MGETPERGGIRPPPQWVTVIVVLVLLGLLCYNIVVVGPEGLPNSYIIGGLLGVYGGVDHILRRKNGGDGDS